MTRRVCWAGLACVVLLAAGCAQNLEVPTGQARTIKATDADAVFGAAVVLLRREFDRVVVDRDKRTAVTAPVEYTTVSDSGTARDLVRARSDMRRIARLSVAQRGNDAIARLRIDLERQDTADHATLRPPGGRLGDSPAYTPIERDAATSKSQNTVWTPVRRDHRLERTLLDELWEQFALRQAGEAAAELPAVAPPKEESNRTP